MHRSIVVEYFNSEKVLNTLGELISKLDSNRNPAILGFECKAICHVLSMVKENAEYLDVSCTYFIDHYFDAFLKYLNGKEIDAIFLTMLYMIHVEYRLSTGKLDNHYVESVFSIYDNLENNADVDKKLKELILYNKHSLPLLWFSWQVNKGDFYQIRKAAEVAPALEGLINEYNKIAGEHIELLNLQKIDIEKYELTLKNQKSEMSFVLLDKGFFNLESDKNKFSKVLFWIMVGFAFLLFAVPASFFWLHVTDYIHVLNPNLPKNLSVFSEISLFIPFVSIEILLIYFFRISLYHFNANKAQILQLELRRSLCQFIEGYSDFSSKIKGKDATALDRFEALIFSGLAPTHETVPTTFDGLDQVEKLVAAIRGKG
jgi:hypothetical protein